MGQRIDSTKGKMKQAAGILSGDKTLEREGKIDRVKGQMKGAVKDIENAAKAAIKK